ncbi:hypothetical protein K488DRAFT_89714 [Vararia minispora EC-137]|uniref:Uncharacterized protein n=1 Tax=Vararia minispora EC-137 TaxID=1314806 RepID=A0ACB8Q9Q5_9AGAM|nr:hypothetical protein K488DRAFT_89714 [Vararia minispora EC-137]
MPPPALSVPSENEPLHTPQPRRTSILSYYSTPTRDGRAERALGRLSRWLVVVLPSESLASRLGSPSDLRASQGILMPLLPTLYAQLTAMAREFNFPSIVGLCVFLHITEQGITTTPRVSEETWQILWGHLFDARSPSVGISQIPVCGRIELDIDVYKARWYDSWVAQRQRAAVPSVAPSVSHWRGDSRTTFLEDHPDDRSESLPPPRPRHVPRQLSLLDRFESGSAVSSLNNTMLRGMPEAEPDVPTAVPEHELEHRPDDRLSRKVRSWRASSSLAPSPMAATGQISLDPVNMPNGIEIQSPPVIEDEEQELRLEDFQWSVSSEGPGDYETLDTPSEWRRVPSVHLDARAEGSVLLSPTSIATSWGPEYDEEAMSYVSWSHVSSVDLARRLEGSVLLSPSVATSWGPDDYAYDYIPALPSSLAIPSPHIADRCLSDAPLTPTTATSWGPDDYDYDHLSGPPPPSHRLSPHIADRCLEDSPRTPTTATSWGPGSYPPSEARVSRPSTPDIAHRFVDDVRAPMKRLPLVWPYLVGAPLSPAGVGALVFPYFVPHETVSRMLWPYHTPVEALVPVDISLKKQYPAVEPYATVYPNLEIYPGHVVAVEKSPEMSAKLASTYPHLVVYETAYPNFEIYPGHKHNFQPEIDMPSVRLPAQYPTLDIYPAVYPALDIYPAVASVQPTIERCATKVSAISTPAMESSVKLPVVYPNVTIYESVYPHGIYEIYPSITGLDEAQELPAVLPTSYPLFNIYPAAYPFFEIYPGAPTLLTDVPVHKAQLNPSLLTAKNFAPYPNFVLYPSPGELLDVCNGEIDVKLPVNYPIVSLYPAQYPAFEVYPGYVCDAELEGQPLEVLPALYPVISLYQARYPFFEIYPGNVHDGELDRSTQVIDVFLHPSYPRITLYPARYPWFEIYPAHYSDGSPGAEWTSVSDTLDAGHLNPRTHLATLRLASPGAESRLSGTSRVKPVKTHAMLHAEVFGSVPRRARRTHAELHNEVFAELQPRLTTHSGQVQSRTLRTPLAGINPKPYDRAVDSEEAAVRTEQILDIESSGSQDVNIPTRSKPSPSFSAHRRTGSSGSTTPSPTIRAFGHRRTGSSESVGSIRGPRAMHRRTESTESTESTDSATGLPRRRDPPPVALRAPIAARRRSVAPKPPPAYPPPPPLDESLFSSDNTLEELPPPLPRRLPEDVTKDGLPLNPAYNRTPPPPQPPRYPHGLSPVAERPPTALHRAMSMQTRAPVLDMSQQAGALSRAASVQSRRAASSPQATVQERKNSIDGVPHAPRRRVRDSLVLERAKMFDGGTDSGPNGEEPPWTGMHATLNDFPAPPPPPVPTLPNGAGRPISRLDRSRYPFA